MSSFGGFGGFGQQNNNNAQQNTGFGGGGFGSNANNNNNTAGGFGSAANTGFGAAANTTPAGGGLFGGGGTAAPSSGFGSSGFGSNTASTGFGAPRPAFGAPAAGTSSTKSAFGGSNTNTQTTTGGFGSGFGSAAQTNTSSGFGAAANTTGGGLFGGSANSNTGFGSTATNTGFGSSATGGFGSAPAATGFGASASTGFGASAQAQNQGTAGTPFQAHTEKDGPANQTIYYQSITFQQPYTNFSFEELRVADYMQGRKYGNQNGQAGAFGTSSGFGGQPTTGAFGAAANTGSNLFGQGNTTTSTGFGQAAAPSTGFGSANNTSTGLFGAPKPATGMFGQSATAPAANTGLFGQPQSSGFGSNTASTGFGASNNQSSGLFGQSNNQVKPLFGQAATPAAGGFGAPAATSGFGAAANTGTGGLFGQSNNNANPSPFGGQPAQATSSFGGFGGNNNTAQATPSPFGGFGANQSSAPKPLFGAPSTATGFGNSLNNNNNTQTSSGLFGGSQQGGPAASNPFGSKPATSNLFGGSSQNNNTGGQGLFGGLNNAQNTNDNSFGNAQNNQQNKGLFGANTTGTNNLFGGLGQNNNQQSNNNLFGGSFNNNQQPLGNSMFNNSLSNSQQSSGQQLTTSIMAQNPYGNEHLFVSLTNTPQSVGPLATPLSSNQKTRKPAPLPPYRINPAASSRLITPQKRTGYGFSYSTYGSPGSSAYGSPALGQSLLTSSTFGSSLGRSASASSLRNYGSGDSILNPNAFSASPMRNFGGSGSMKKLRIDRSIRTDLFGVDGANDVNRPSPLKKIVSFENEDTATQSNGATDETDDSSRALVRVEESNSAEPSPEEQGLLRSSRNGREKSQGKKESSRNGDSQVQGNELAIVPEDGSPPPPPARSSAPADENIRHSQKDQKVGPYFMTPSKAELEKMSRAQLSGVKDLVVGREGVGKIVFHEPDLTSVNLDKICGDIVRLETRTATVYVDPVGKPPVGKGLNVYSTISLVNSWPRANRGTTAIYDKKGPRFDKHIQRLKAVSGTKFVEYNADHGEWIFDVEHFSTYALDYTTTDFGMSDSAEDLIDFRNSRALPGTFDTDMDFDMLNTGYDNDFNPNDSFFSAGLDQGVQQSSHVADVNGLASRSVADVVQRDADGLGNDPAAPATPARAPPKSILKASMANFGSPLRKPILDVDWDEQLIRTISPKKQDRRLLRESQGAVLKELYQSKPVPSVVDKEVNPFATSIDVMKSLFGDNTPANGQRGKKQGSDGKGFQWPYAKKPKADDTMIETDKAYHASFKPGWAPDATLIYATDTTSSTKSQDGVLIDVRTPLTTGGKEVKFVGFASINAASQTLEKQKELTLIEVDHGVPIARLTDTFTFSDIVAPLQGSVSKNIHEKQMWELAAILFDDLPENEEFDANMARKERFSAFWKELVEPRAVEQANKAESAEEKAIAYLTCFNLWDASDALLQGKDFRLAAMIAQIGGDEGSKEGMAQQIEEWRRSNVISEMALPIRALYELLAGNTCVSQGKTGAGSENRAETFNIGARFNLDWRQVFGLKFWYGSATTNALPESVAAYGDDLSTKKEQVKPVPWFVDQKNAAASNEKRQDILWGLLKLYGEKANYDNFAGLGEIISSENLSNNPLDARLSFQLYQFLQARGIADFDPYTREHKADLLATDYAFQLSSLAADASPASFCDAVFVTLHLTSPTARRAAVRFLLNRHAGSIGDNPATCPTFRTLIEKLRIPTAWVWTAKALYAKAVLGDQAIEVRCLLRAGEVLEAHGTLCKVVAPKAVIEEDLEGLGSLIAAFEEVRGTAVEGWIRGGAVYTAFVKLNDAATHKEEKEALMDRLEAALPGLMKEGCLEERVAMREMADVVEQMRVAAGGETRAALAAVGLDNAVYAEAVRLRDEYYARLAAAA